MAGHAARQRRLRSVALHLSPAGGKASPLPEGLGDALEADPSVWTGDEMSADPASWRYRLDPGQLGELGAALRDVKARGLPFHRIQAADYPLPALQPLVAEIRHNLSWGRGFCVLSGFPTEHDEEDTERAFWLLSSHVGVCLSQDGNASVRPTCHLQSAAFLWGSDGCVACTS